jgi:hypothetical protein
VIEQTAPGAEPTSESCMDDDDPKCCLCLVSESPDAAARVIRTTCEAAAQRCHGVIPSRHLDELQRYYIPEARAAELTTIFQKAASEHRARLVIVVDGAGKPQIETLLVDGTPIEQVR